MRCPPHALSRAMSCAFLTTHACVVRNAERNQRLCSHARAVCLAASADGYKDVLVLIFYLFLGSPCMSFLLPYFFMSCLSSGTIIPAVPARSSSGVRERQGAADGGRGRQGGRQGAGSQAEGCPSLCLLHPSVAVLRVSCRCRSPSHAVQACFMRSPAPAKGRMAQKVVVPTALWCHSTVLLVPINALQSLQTDAPLVRTGYVGAISKPSSRREKRNSRNRAGDQGTHDTASEWEAEETSDLLLPSSPPSSSRWRLPRVSLPHVSYQLPQHLCLVAARAEGNGSLSSLGGRGQRLCTASLCAVATHPWTCDTQALGSLGKVLPALPWTPSKVCRPLLSHAACATDARM
jgi:hypothetical protein